MVNRITDCAIVTTDPVGSIISWNSYAQTLYGYEKSEIIGKPIATLYTPEAIKDDEPAANLQFTLLNTSRFSKELRVKKDGSKFKADINCTAIFNREHELIAYTEISQYLKKSKAAGKHLPPQTAAKKPPHQFVTGDIHFRKLIENSHEGIALLDKNFSVVFRNLSAEKINGWNDAGKVPNSITQLVHPDDVKIISFIKKRVLNNPGLAVMCSFRSKHYKGNFIWLECVFTNFLNDPDISGIVCNFKDITEAKLNEEKIIESARFIKTITDNVPALITYWTADLHCLFANKPCLEWFDKQLHEMHGITKRELLGENEFMLHEGHIQNVLKGEAQSFERVFYNSKGKSIHTYTQYLPEKENDVVKGFYSLIYDTSEIKLAEKEISRKTKQVENILESIGEAFFAVDKNWTITYWNSMAEKYMKKTRGEVLNKNIWEIFPKAVNSKAYIKYHEAFETNKVIHFELYGIYLKNWSDISVFPSKNGLSVYIKDISERKKAELVVAHAQEEKNAILESIGDAFFAVDKNWIITYWNNMAEKYMGKTRAEVLNKNIWEIYPKAVHSEAFLKYQEALETNKAVHFELYSIYLKNWSDISAFPTKNGLSVYIRDINERKNAELVAARSQEEKNTILESIGDAFFAVDKNWIVTYWNKAAEIALSKTKEEMINSYLWDVFSDSIDSISYKKYHQAIETNKAVYFEDYYDALIRWYDISAYPTGNGLSVYFKDITQRKLADIQLKDLNQHLQKQAKELAISNAELEQFAYVASHDLQEPLRMVTGFLSQIEKKYGSIIDDRGKQYIHFAVDGAKRMRQIILDLLEFSRIGGIEDDQEDVDLNKVVNEITALYRKQIEETRASINFNNLPTFKTHKTPMRQVFQNLIANSLKYHQLNKQPEITIACKETGDHWQFSVKDNGIGIEAEYFNKIFIIFQRLHNKDEYSGTGMGLAISKKIIENMGGKIWVKSEPGVGSTFYFTVFKHDSV